MNAVAWIIKRPVGTPGAYPDKERYFLRGGRSPRAEWTLVPHRAYRFSTRDTAEYAADFVGGKVVARVKAPSRTLRLWCGTCGKDLPYMCAGPDCDPCAKWWKDNAPAWEEPVPTC